MPCQSVELPMSPKSTPVSVSDVAVVPGRNELPQPVLPDELPVPLLLPVLPLCFRWCSRWSCRRRSSR